MTEFVRDSDDRSVDAGFWSRVARLDERQRAMVVAGITALLHAPSFKRPLLDSDEAVYASIAALVNAGGRLYAEGGVDNKFPAIYYTYAALFQVFGRYAMWAVHGATLVVVLATSWVLGRIARRFAGESAAHLTALTYGILTIFFYPKMLAANTEVFMTLPLAVSVLISLPDEEEQPPSFVMVFVAGALIGVSAMYRQLAALNLAVSAVAPLLARGNFVRRLVTAAAAPLGFAAAFGALLGVYAAHGNLDDFLYWTVKMVTTRYLPGGWRYGWPLGQLSAMAAVMLVPIGLTVLRARRAWLNRPVASVEKIVWLWLVVGTAAILVLWRFHPHYVIHAVAPGSILAATELGARLREAPEAARHRFATWLGIVIAIESAVFVVLAMVLEPIAGGVEPPKPNYPPVADYIREHTAPEQRVFVWGAWSPLYVLADRLPASRFVGFMRGCPRVPEMPLLKCWDSGPRTWEILEEEFRAAPPELIVDTSTMYEYGNFAYYPLKTTPVVGDWVARSYVKERDVEGVAIYRRKR